MKRFPSLLFGLAVLLPLSGCLCGPHTCWHWGNWGPGYQGCPDGGCGVAPGGPPPVLPQQGNYQGGYNSTQTGYPVASPGPVAGPTMQPGIPRTAVAPLDPLPTY